MTKVRTTLTIDDSVLRAVKVRAARAGKGQSEVVEDALRLALGLDLLEGMWSCGELSEADASSLTLEAQHATRPPRR